MPNKPYYQVTLRIDAEKIHNYFGNNVGDISWFLHRLIRGVKYMFDEKAYITHASCELVEDE